MPKIKAALDVSYTVRITQDLEDQILKFAEDNGHSKTSAIRHLIERGLRKNSQPAVVNSIKEAS